MIGVADLLLACCAVVYGGLAILIVLRGRQVAPLMLAASCLITASWAAVAWQTKVSAAAGWPGGDWGGGADLLRALAWFWLLFYLYFHAGLGQKLHQIGFGLAGIVATALAFAAIILGPASSATVSVFSWSIAARLCLGVVELLLIENLYLNLPDHARWHVALPSVLLGGLACFDILLCADLVLFQHSSVALMAARTLAMIMVAPLLAVAGARWQRAGARWRGGARVQPWRGKVKLSRSAVFHSATLLLSGSVLLALGVAGEVFRKFGPNWGLLAEISLVFAALIATAILVTSGSARSRFQRMIVDHFFAERYDYRRQWQACIRTLAGDDGDPTSALSARAIRAVASVVDSPAGLLFLRDGGGGAFNWTGSWNMPAVDSLPAHHPMVAAVQEGSWIPRLDGPDSAALTGAPFDAVGPLWLTVPLTHRQVLIGLVVVVRPRAPFDLVTEVFDLLRIVAQEVATFIAEQRATQTLLQTRELHDYGKRFAFVAHDIKNVSSQLGLLLSNAESHLANPEFQKDMLETVRSSVRKTTALLQRLEQPAVDTASTVLTPLRRLEALVATYLRVRKAQLVLEHDGSTGSVGMGAEAFETAVTHLLNNAVEAGGAGPVVVRVRHEARDVVVDIVDRGPGMTPEFVRDRLFRPFSTSKAGGSGIGAYQSRELVRGAGGELLVIGGPGLGTTMRMLLPRTDVRPEVRDGAATKAFSIVGA